MKILPIVCRVLLGLMFVVFGANILHPFLPPQPMPPPDSLPGQFMAVMMASGWMYIVGLLQVIGGLLVLIGGTTPLGLVFLGPIIVNIWIFHLHMLGGKGLAPGAVAMLLELLLIYFYRDNFAGIFTIGARPVIKPKPVTV